MISSLGRSFALLLALSPFAGAQTAKPSSYFLIQVNSLAIVSPNDGSSSRERLQNKLNFTERDTNSLIEAARDFQAQSQGIETALRAMVQERRLSIIAGDTVSTPPESELVAMSERKKEELADREIEDLKARLGAEKLEAFKAYLESGEYMAEAAKRYR